MTFIEIQAIAEKIVADAEALKDECIEQLREIGINV